MPRPRPGFYSTIEYIGPRPQKPKRRNFFGGWVIIVIALGMGFWFGRPLIPFLKATQVVTSMENADLLISSLKESKDFGGGLAAAALALDRRPVLAGCLFGLLTCKPQFGLLLPFAPAPPSALPKMEESESERGSALGRQAGRHCPAKLIGHK